MYGVYRVSGLGFVGFRIERVTFEGFGLYRI